MWQDGIVNNGDDAAASDSGQGSASPVSNAETLRALADPLRLRILSTLMRRDYGDLPVMSVKELATDLGEPQTKLYRHVKHLESAGLIKAVSSRVVSGIVEQRYQACQSDLSLGTGLDERERASAEAEAAAAAVLELYRSQFFAAYRSGLATDGAPGTADHERRSDTILCMTAIRVPRAKAAEIQARLQQLADDMTEAESSAPGADTVSVNVLLGYFNSDAGQGDAGS